MKHVEIVSKYLVALGLRAEDAPAVGALDCQTFADNVNYNSGMNKDMIHMALDGIGEFTESAVAHMKSVVGEIEGFFDGEEPVEADGDDFDDVAEVNGDDFDDVAEVNEPAEGDDVTEVNLPADEVEEPKEETLVEDQPTLVEGDDVTDVNVPAEADEPALEEAAVEEPKEVEAPLFGVADDKEHGAE